MISYLDDKVGKLVQQLKNPGLYENTLIMFSSDNGPAETTDISVQHPEIIAQAEEIVAREHTTSPNKMWRYVVLGEER